MAAELDGEEGEIDGAGRPAVRGRTGRMIAWHRTVLPTLLAPLDCWRATSVLQCGLMKAFRDWAYLAHRAGPYRAAGVAFVSAVGGWPPSERGHTE